MHSENTNDTRSFEKSIYKQIVSFCSHLQKVGVSSLDILGTKCKHWLKNEAFVLLSLCMYMVILRIFCFHLEIIGTNTGIRREHGMTKKLPSLY